MAFLLDLSIDRLRTGGFKVQVQARFQRSDRKHQGGQAADAEDVCWPRVFPKPEADSGEQRHHLGADRTDQEIARVPVRRGDHQAMQPPEHVRSMPRATHHAELHGVHDQSGLMRVIFDPLIESDAINPCWLKLIA
jgi:hypothetical protein